MKVYDENGDFTKEARQELLNTLLQIHKNKCFRNNEEDFMEINVIKEKISTNSLNYDYNEYTKLLDYYKIPYEVKSHHIFGISIFVNKVQMLDLIEKECRCEYCNEENNANCSGSDHIYYNNIANKYYLIAEHYKDEVINIESKYCLECGRKLIVKPI